MQLPAQEVDVGDLQGAGLTQAQTGEGADRDERGPPDRPGPYNCLSLTMTAVLLWLQTPQATFTSPITLACSNCRVIARETQITALMS